VTCSIFPARQVFAELQEFELPSGKLFIVYLSNLGWAGADRRRQMIDTAPISGIRAAPDDTLVFRRAGHMGAAGKTPVTDEMDFAGLPKARRVASVCLGAFVLAWTGALDGKRARDALAYCRAGGRLSKIRVDGNAIFVKDGRSGHRRASAPASILALAMIEEDSGIPPRSTSPKAGGVSERPAAKSVLDRARGARPPTSKAGSARCMPGSPKTSPAISRSKRSARKSRNESRTFARLYDPYGNDAASGSRPLRVEPAAAAVESSESVAWSRWRGAQVR